MYKKPIFLFKLFIALAILMLLASCGSFSFFGKSAAPADEPAQTSSIDADTDSSLRTRVSDLARNQEALQKEVQQKEETITALNHKVSELEKKLFALENKAPEVKKAPQKIDETTPEDLYQKARNLLIENRYDEAAAHFSSFIDRYPDHGLSDNAMYWLGECHYSGGSYQEAILVFKDLAKKYPKSEKVPDALLKTGYSYISLDDTNRANHFLKQVLKQYPFSPAAEKAQEKLKEFD